MLIAAAIRRRLEGSPEGGFTLIELLVSITIGIVVLIGLMNLIDTSGRASARLTDKAETVQRTRISMERALRVLRTQACLNISTPPVIEGTADSVTFYSDNPTKAQVDAGQDDSTGIVYKPKKVRLTFSTSGTGSILQETWETPNGQPAGTYPNPPVARTLATNIGRDGSTPFLRYYSFANLSPNAFVAVPLDGNLNADPPAANSVVKVVKIDVAFQALPTSGNAEGARRTALAGSATSRNADLSGAADPERKWGPRCG